MSLRGRGVGLRNYVGLWSSAALINYAALSARVPRTRFVTGISNVTRQLVKQNTTCAILSVEKPLPAHLTSVTEWWSGTHDLAGLVPSVTWHHGRWLAVAGSRISNLSGSRTDGVILEVGHTF